MKEKHHKHPPLKRPKKGFYHRNEWAIYGTTCGKISEAYHSINKGLEHLKVAYIDADHGGTTSITNTQIGKKNFTLPQHSEWNKYDDAIQCNEYDVVIVNGNHYPASRQIVIIDPAKKESLYRRKDQLTKIDIVLKSDDTEIYDFVKERMTGETKVCALESLSEVTKIVNESVTGNTPLIKALILAGGKSLRMGKDKSNIVYHDKPQQIHVAEFCRSLGMETYISKQHDYAQDNIEGFSVIKDRIKGMGPFGAIISAMMHDPDAAWCVLACDLPFINTSTIETLVAKRNISKYATAFHASSKDFPEPLITIYEPRSYARFLSFLTLGYACPRKVLINSDIETILIEDEAMIENVNTPEEMNKILAELNTKNG